MDNTSTSTQLQTVETQTDGVLQVVDMGSVNAVAMEEALNKAEALPFELTPNYWTPTMQGECRKLVFSKIVNEKYQDTKTDETIELETAHFTEFKEGVAQVVKNAGWRLVKAVRDFQPGTILMITYLGKKKNSTNSFMSDSWSVKPLLIKI